MTIDIEAALAESLEAERKLDLLESHAHSLDIVMLMANVNAQSTCNLYGTIEELIDLIDVRSTDVIFYEVRRFDHAAEIEWIKPDAAIDETIEPLKALDGKIVSLRAVTSFDGVTFSTGTSVEWYEEALRAISTAQTQAITRQVEQDLKREEAVQDQPAPPVRPTSAKWSLKRLTQRL